MLWTHDRRLAASADITVVLADGGDPHDPRAGPDQQKTRLSSRAELVRYALEHQLIDTSP
jgi:hypothetical protein